MMFYNKVVCQRLRGEAAQISDVNGFDLPTLHKEADWQQLAADAMDAARKLAEAISNFPEEQLFDEHPPGKGFLQKISWRHRTQLLSPRPNRYH